MTQFTVFKSKKNNRWYWHLTAANGEIILKTEESDGFDTTQHALDECAAVRKAVAAHTQGDTHIERFPGKNKDKYFRIVDGDGVILAVSEGYATDGSRAKGIDSVLANALVAEITITA